MTIETVRALVRPATTMLLVGALIAGAFWDAGAVDHIKDPALMIIAYWFGQRNAP